MFATLELAFHYAYAHINGLFDTRTHPIDHVEESGYVQSKWERKSSFEEFPVGAIKMSDNFYVTSRSLVLVDQVETYMLMSTQTAV